MVRVSEIDVDRDYRLRALVAAGIALSSEPSLDELLERLVRIAAELTGARYAALGVIDPAGDELERFITQGVGGEEAVAIGALPRGRGILGVLIHDVETLRLHSLGDDPRSVGFPPNHPPMRSFLGVPVVLRGVAYGNLYLTEKGDGADFDADDEDLVGLLAAQAAVATENARLYEASRRWSQQLEALNEIGTALATEIDLPRLLELIVRRLCELIDARVIAIAVPRADGTLVIEAAQGEPRNRGPRDLDQVRGGGACPTRCPDRGHNPVRPPDGDSSRTQTLPRGIHGPGGSTGVGAPRTYRVLLRV